MGARNHSVWIHFDSFSLDLTNAELRRSGVAVKLAPQPARILSILASHAGEVVSQEQIAEEIWGEGTFVDYAQSVKASMRQIRIALQDDAEHPTFIETVSKRGYRFIAHIVSVEGPSGLAPDPVREGVLSGATSDAPLVAAGSISRPWYRKPVGLTMAVAVLLALATALFTSLRFFSPVAASTGRVTLVVLPVQNLSGDSSRDYISDGLTEEMIAQLGRLNPQKLAVIARTSSMAYKNSSKRVDQIAREVHANYVLESSLRWEQGGIRLTSQLIRAGDQTHLWAQSYDEGLGDPVNMERDGAESVTKEVALRLGGKPGPRQVPASAINPQAHEAYLRGRYDLNKLSGQGYENAMEHFNQAIAADPNYALAYVGVAEAQIQMTPDYRAPLESMPAARAAAEKAIALDDSLAEAHAALGTVKLMYDWDWGGAEREFRRAVALDPNSADAHTGYSQYYTATGQAEAAVREAKIAEMLDPLSEKAVWDCYAARHYDDAIRQSEGLLELRPDNGWADSIIALSYSAEGREQEAVSAADRSGQLSKNFMVQIAQADVYANAGRRKQAEEMLAHLVAESRQQYVCGVQMATLYASLGRKDEAFESLERAYLQRSD